MSKKLPLLKLLFIACCVLWISTAQAQDDPPKTAALIGITSPVLDNGWGGQVGVGPHKALTSHLGLEGQISYTFTRITGSFLSGETGNIHSVNTLIGPRLYLNGEEKSTRYYVNAVVGGLYSSDETNKGFSEPLLGIGFSSGLYLERENWLTGISIETPQYVVLKLGYRL